MSSLIEIRNERLAKVKALRDLGINPYPTTSAKGIKNAEVVEKYPELEGQTVTVAGRLMGWREHGGLIFGHIQDQSGRVQLYIEPNELKKTNQEDQCIGEEHLSYIDVGDLLEAEGIVTKTKTGEVSVRPVCIRMLAKSIRPLPDKHEGLKDPELLVRKRYLDMIMNPEKRYRFEKAAEILFAIREFLDSKGYLEIKTPILQPTYGGGLAKPFLTNVNALGEDFYLAIAHELYLKRLITAGFENVYNIVGYFRNEGIDRSHNPEFNMLETMSAYNNYEYNMDLIEEMYTYIGNKVFGKTTFMVEGHEIDFAKPWPRLQMLDAVKMHAGVDFNGVEDLAAAHKVLDDIGYGGDKPNSIGECMVIVFEEKVEEKLIEPTFITGHPVEISPLAKRRDDDPRFVERFEIFIGGIEGGDNWTELNDPVELYERFKEQDDRKSEGDDEAHPLDWEFIEMMEYGMPPTTGLGPGIERLTMMFTEAKHIDDVVFFPMLRRAKVDATQRELYGIGETDARIEQDFSKKMIIAIRKDLPQWQAMNAVGHVSAYLGNKMQAKFDTGEVFLTKDKIGHPRNSQFPVVLVGAEEKDLKKLIGKARESGLLYHGFLRQMLEATNDTEITNWLKEIDDADLEYLAIGVFGPNEEVAKLTKKLSVWKG